MKQDEVLKLIEEASQRPRDPKIPNRGTLAAPDLVPTPKDINFENHFFNAFENNETEVSAWWLCKMAQERGGWFPFTRADIEAVYGRKFQHGFYFNHLVERGTGFGMPGERYLMGGGWIVRILSDRGVGAANSLQYEVAEAQAQYFFTEEFIMRCYLSSNNKKKEFDRRFPWQDEKAKNTPL